LADQHLADHGFAAGASDTAGAAPELLGDARLRGIDAGLVPDFGTIGTSDHRLRIFFGAFGARFGNLGDRIL
jgi:hypothetical protein